MVTIEQKPTDTIEGKEPCIECEAKDKEITELKEKVTYLEKLLQK